MDKEQNIEEWEVKSKAYATKAVQFGHENAMLYDMLHEIGEYWLSKIESEKARIRERIIGMRIDENANLGGIDYNQALDDILEIIN